MLVDRLLDNLSMQVEPFATCQIANGETLRFDQRDWVTAHFVLAGSGSLNVKGRPARKLERHSLALVPGDLVHSISGLPGGEEEDVDRFEVEGLARHLVGPEDAPGLLLACGTIHAVYGQALGLFDRMDDAVVLDFSDSSLVQQSFDTMLEESKTSAPGRQAVLRAAMNQCLVMVFRQLCGEPDCSLPWLDVLEDPSLAPVIDAVLSRPREAYSVGSLADLASMSRSAFSDRFVESFGRTPMAWVREVRLRRGAELLKTTDLTVDAISRDVGYSSRSHFSKAFHEYFGVSPAEFRVAA